MSHNNCESSDVHLSKLFKWVCCTYASNKASLN